MFGNIPIIRKYSEKVWRFEFVRTEQNIFGKRFGEG